MSRRTALLAGLTAMTAVGFGLIVYFTGASVAWFASSPTSDPLFGTLNECVLRELPQARGGFAVSAQGTAVAAYDGRGVVICTPGEGGPSRRWVALAGISSAAWDFEGNLWVGTAGKDAAAPALWRVPEEGAPVLAGEAPVVELAGHAEGVVALDASGKLMSLAPDGRALGYAELPLPPPEDVQLSVDAAGEVVSVVAGGAVWLYRTADLRPLRAESPCEVAYLWWLPQKGRALIACGADQSWALIFDPYTGARDAAPRRERRPSVLLPERGEYVRDCSRLPCQAEAPQG